MDKEMELLKNKVWELTKLPPGKKAIGCKWVYKVKTNGDGSIERYKARLVARGFDQRFGSNCDETFCPVVRLESLRTLVVLATQRGLAPSCGCRDSFPEWHSTGRGVYEAAGWLCERG